MAGNITIYEPEENYQKVSKSIIFDETIDALTLGIYVKILCLGKEWNLNIAGLSSLLELSSAKIKTAISKLEKAGYIKRQRVRDENNHFIGWDYVVSSIPFDPAERSDLSKSRQSENPTIGKTDSRENQRLEIPTVGKSDCINRDDSIDGDKKNKQISKSKQKEGLKLPFDSKVFSETWALLIEQPKWRNKSVGALEMSLKKLAEHPEHVAVEMMQNSIAGNWQGLFEPDTKRGPKHDDRFFDKYHINERWGR